MKHPLEEALEAAAELLPQNVISMLHFDREAIEAVALLAGAIQEAPGERQAHIMRHQTVAVMFYQPSTRTRLNFESAAGRLGAHVTGFADPKQTRAGDFYQESLEDVIRFTGELADMLVLRHPETGASVRAAKVTTVPLISAGDGYNEHPTQALGDICTMLRVLGTLEGKTIGLLGNPSIRSLHSIALGLAVLPVGKIRFLPAPDTAIPERVCARLREHGVAFDQAESVEELLQTTDLIETIGTRHPRHDRPFDMAVEASETPARYRVDRRTLEAAGTRIPILHPGPRTDEIDADVDDMPQAYYFAQARTGLFVRMALMAALSIKGRQGRPCVMGAGGADACAF